VLLRAGFKPQDAEPGSESLLCQALNDCIGHALPARRRTDVHALEFAKIGKQRDAAAADRFAVGSRDEKPNVWLKESFESQAVLLFRRIMLRQFGIEGA
jgi:hypothetical protein